MPFTSLEIQLEGPVATIWMNRPDLHNAFDETLIAELTAACIALDDDADVRVIVLAGRGKSFSAGADLNWMRRAAEASVEANLADARKLAGMLRTLAEMDKPTIARVHGAAFGGGVGLVACCDIVIAAEGARFGLTESRLGLLPAVISPYVIAAIGPREARRWFATGEHFDAATAQQIGLVHQVVAADALDAAVQAQLALLGKAGPVAAASAKVLVRDVLALGSDRDALDAANAGLIAALRASDEGREGLSAFLEKRAPRWADKQ